MRIVTVKIEDNTNKINEIKELENAKFMIIENISDKIDELQEEAFMQILAYVRCAYEDYIEIVGEITPINSVSWEENRLCVSNVSNSVRICVGKSGVFIDFNYMGTSNCGNTPPKMKAEFNNGNIIITESTRNGICDLMQYWKGIKPKFQEEIDKAYEKQTNKIKSDINSLEYLLKVAEKFKV